VRNIAGYNEALRAGEPRMPYIVIVIDELADLMMVSAYEVEATDHPDRAARPGRPASTSSSPRSAHRSRSSPA
jgi:hypothetical protein